MAIKDMFGLWNFCIDLGMILFILESLEFSMILTRSKHSLRHLGYILSLNIHLRGKVSYFGINTIME